LLPYPLAVTGLVHHLRQQCRRTRTEALLDAGVVAAGLAMPVWTYLLDPVVDGTAIGWGLALRLAYPILDVVLATVATRFLFPGGRPSPARLLVLLAGVALLAVGSAVRLSPAEPGPVPVHPAWLVWAVLIAVAALHPAAARPVEPAVPGDRALPRRHLAA